jgi:hypothetical protein
VLGRHLGPADDESWNAALVRSPRNGQLDVVLAARQVDAPEDRRARPRHDGTRDDEEGRPHTTDVGDRDITVQVDVRVETSPGRPTESVPGEQAGMDRIRSAEDLVP